MKVVELPAPMVCAPPGVTWSSEGLLELPVIERLVVELCLTVTVAVPSIRRANDERSVEMVQTAGAGVAFGVAAGLAAGVAAGLAAGVALGLAAGVGISIGRVPSTLGVGVSIGVPPRSGVALASGVGVAMADGVGSGVAPEARSPTFRSTFGTESSKTALSMVTSPEPVTSIEIDAVSFFKRIET